MTATSRLFRSEVVRLVAAIAACAVVASCAVQIDASPRDITANELPGEQPFVGGRQPAVASSNADTTVYLVSAQGDTQLRPVGRDTGDTLRERVEALLSGVTLSEQASRLTTAIPIETTIRRVEVSEDGVAVLDLSEAFSQLDGTPLIDALAQLVFTATESPGVAAVSVTVEGVPREWPRGDGSVTSQPLRRFDYPDRDPSTQPDFPAVPSPIADTQS